jgi:uncharacterized coiled-coil protein SlyX
MGKRVNITYSIEIDKIHETMGDLINKVHNSDYRLIDKRFNELLISLNKENEKEALQTIEEMRNLLVNVDVCLADCRGILSEYQKKMLNLEEDANDGTKL